MNLRKTLLLGIVLVVAVSYLVMVAEPRRQQELNQNKVLATASPSTVASVTFQPKAGAPYTLQHGEVKGGEEIEWRLAELPMGKLDKEKVESVLAAMKELVFEGPIEDSELERDFSTYGLDTPALTMLVRDPTGSEMELAFGKESEYLSKRYAKVSGKSGLFMVDSATFGRLLKQRNELRQVSPIAFNTADVREVVLESVQGAIKLTQPALGGWQIVSPVSYGASSTSVEEVLGAIRKLRAQEFIDGGERRLQEFGLDMPRVSATITLRDGLEDKVIQVLIGTPKGEGSQSWFFTYKGAPSVFKFTPEKTPFLEMRVADLREKKLFAWEAKDIESISSAGSAEAPVEIKSTRSDWDVNGKRSDPVFVEQLLNDIVSLESSSFPEAVPADAFAQMFLTLTLKKKSPSVDTVTLLIGKEVSVGSDRYRYAKVGENGPVSLVRDVEAKRIVPHEGALVEKATPMPSTPAAPDAT